MKLNRYSVPSQITSFAICFACSLLIFSCSSGGGSLSSTGSNPLSPSFSVTAIEAGGSHSLALKSDGSVVAWGDNVTGQLGDGTNTASNTPVQVSGLTNNVIAIVAGSDHSLALKSDGSVVAWGDNATGQLGNGTNTASNTPVQVSGLTSGVIAIASGSDHSLALKSDGSVVAWGDNLSGQLGNGNNNSSNSPVAVSGLTSGVIAIASGSDHSLALKSDGSVVTWGDNLSGQLGNGNNNSSNSPVAVSGLTSGVTAIAGGGDHSLALKNDGSVVAWGDNQLGQLGNGNNIASNTPVQVSGLTDAEAIATGGNHSLALKSDGTAWAWGDNQFGQLGDGTNSTSNAPVQSTG